MNRPLVVTLLLLTTVVPAADGQWGTSVAPAIPEADGVASDALIVLMARQSDGYALMSF